MSNDKARPPKGQKTKKAAGKDLTARTADDVFGGRRATFSGGPVTEVKLDDLDANNNK